MKKTSQKSINKNKTRWVPLSETEKGHITHEYAMAGCCVNTAWKACRKNYTCFADLTTLRIHRLLRSTEFNRQVTLKIAARILDEHTKRQIDPVPGDRFFD